MKNIQDKKRLNKTRQKKPNHQTHNFQTKRICANTVL